MLTSISWNRCQTDNRSSSWCKTDLLSRNAGHIVSRWRNTQIRWSESNELVSRQSLVARPSGGGVAAKQDDLIDLPGKVQRGCELTQRFECASVDVARHREMRAWPMSLVERARSEPCIDVECQGSSLRRAVRQRQPRHSPTSRSRPVVDAAAGSAGRCGVARVIPRHTFHDA